MFFLSKVHAFCINESAATVKCNFVMPRKKHKTTINMPKWRLALNYNYTVGREKAFLEQGKTILVVKYVVT